MLKEKQELQLPNFRLINIEEKQFSKFPIDDIVNGEIREKVGFNFGIYENESGELAIGCGCLYTLENNDKPFINVEAVCFFEFNDLDKSVKIPYLLKKEVARHLAVITSGTTRGILFAHTKNTPYAAYPMRLLNVKSMVEEDIELEF